MNNTKWPHVLLATLLNLAFFSSTAVAANLSGVFQSRWKPNVNLSVNGVSQYTLEDAGNGYYRIKDSAQNKYLNIEKGSLQSTAAPSDWYSAQWSLTPSESGFFRIQNRWKNTQYIHIENGNAQAGEFKITGGVHSGNF